MLTNEEFENILNTQKFFINSNIKSCKIGENISYDLISNNDNKKFKLDVDRKTRSISLNKIKIQNRFDSIPLVRIDIDSPPHMNPDGVIIPRNHIHIYKEGYGLKWAFNLDEFHNIYFKNINIFNNLFIDFCNFCNIDVSKLNNFQGVI